MFSSLKIKSFRLYWFSMVISLIGTWIQTVVQSWLVFQLTDSAFLLGLVGFLGAIPVCALSLFAGVFADRANRKNILLLTQLAFMVLAFILAILTQMKLITPWHIMFIALLNGIVMAFDAPSRQAMVVELVSKKYLVNAIALNSVAFHSSRIIGPALAGILVASIGMSGCFYINGISFLAPIIALLLIKIDNSNNQNAKVSFAQDIRELFEFIKKNRIILMLVVMVAMLSLFGASYLILMPIFADKILKVGLPGLGMLMSAAGVGALLAGLILARLGDFEYKGKLLILSSILCSISLVLFALSRIYLLSIIFLVLIGWGSVTSIGLINILLQTLVSDGLRGRLTGLFMFTFAGIMPLGNLIAGSIAQIFGASFAVFIGGLICVVFFLSINILSPDIKKLS